MVLKNNIQFVFATGSPWSSLVAGCLISKFTKRPLIVDFRDPWINNPFNVSKGMLLDYLSKKLEEIIVKHASIVALNTEPLFDEFLQRYSKIPSDKFFVLPNGYEEDNNFNIPKVCIDNLDRDLVIRHAGALYGLRDPSVLLRAIKVANLFAQKKGLPRRWVFEQIGDVSLSIDLSCEFADMLNEGSFVITRQLEYKKCQEILKSSDMLVNIQPGTRTQIPSKFYDYLASNRPILNITPKSGALGVISKKYNIGICFENADIESLQEFLISRLVTLDWLSSEVYHNKDIFNMTNIAKLLECRINGLHKPQ